MESEIRFKKISRGISEREAIKDDKFFTNLYEGLSKVYKDINRDKSNKRVPDLVLHKDQGSNKAEGRICLAEIKMGDNDKAVDDLLKLSMLKDSKLHFDFYIFLCPKDNWRTQRRTKRKIKLYL